MIHDKAECKKFFTEVTGLANVIDKYMICTLEAGNLNEHGEQIVKTRPLADGCTPNLKLLAHGEIQVCSNHFQQEVEAKIS
jgi:hypothetical protein